MRSLVEKVRGLSGKLLQYTMRQFPVVSKKSKFITRFCQVFVNHLVN